MIRSQLIKAIFDNEERWSCPDDPCDLPEEEGNSGKCCWKCAEKQLAKYEAKIRAKAIKDCISIVDGYLVDMPITHDNTIKALCKLKEEK